MHVRGISPISAEPILGLVRAHARRTVLGRLGVVYEITPSPSSRPALVIAATHQPENVSVHDPFGAKPQPQALITLGEALYMDSIIEGGVNGEELPVTIDRGVELNLLAHTPESALELAGMRRATNCLKSWQISGQGRHEREPGLLSGFSLKARQFS